MMAFEDMALMSRATSLAIYELLGDAALMNTELERYRRVTADEVKEESRRIFTPQNSNTIYYYAEN
jgi:hypothetical protein